MGNAVFSENPLPKPSPPLLAPTKLLKCAHPESREYALTRAASGCYGDILTILDGELPLEKRGDYKDLTLVFAKAHRGGQITIPSWLSAHRNKADPLGGEPHPSRGVPELDCVLKKLTSLGLPYDLAYSEANSLDKLYRGLQSKMTEALRQAWEEAVKGNTYDESFLLAMGLCYEVFQEWWDDHHRKPFYKQKAEEFKRRQRLKDYKFDISRFYNLL